MNSAKETPLLTAPVQELLDEIVIPSSSLFSWDMPDLLGLNQWYIEAQEFQDKQMQEHNKRMDEIAAGYVKIETGQLKLPVPHKRRRTRARKTNGKELNQG